MPGLLSRSFLRCQGPNHFGMDQSGVYIGVMYFNLDGQFTMVSNRVDGKVKYEQTSHDRIVETRFV